MPESWVMQPMVIEAMECLEFLLHQKPPLLILQFTGLHSMAGPVPFRSADSLDFQAAYQLMGLQLLSWRTMVLKLHQYSSPAITVAKCSESPTVATSASGLPPSALSCLLLFQILHPMSWWRKDLSAPILTQPEPRA